MADLIDEVLEDEVLDKTTTKEPLEEASLEKESLDDVLPLVKEKETKEEVVEEEVEDDLPEKYKGKSTKEIIAMHQEAEKLIGRQGGEVGDLRQVVDDFIKTQTEIKQQKHETEVTPEDFYDDPAKHVKNEIDSHPAIKEAREQALQMKRTTTLTRLNSEFPELDTIIQDPSFAEWIKGSKVRSELYNRAEVHFDYDSAKELLGNWVDKKTRISKVKETSRIDKENQLKAADTGSKGNNETVSKKKYRRSDIIKLMQTDPDRYDDMSDEIMLAYQENRVI